MNGTSRLLEHAFVMAASTSLMYLVPAAAVLIAFVWLGEAPHLSELLGGLVVLAGVVLGFGILDLVLGILFVAAFRQTPVRSG